MNNYLFDGMSKNYKRQSLGTLNIQRGRDHGLPGYNKFRAWCGLNYAYSFDELTNIPREVRNELKYLYNHVDDIDLFTGAMSEFAVDDGVVGPTTACKCCGFLAKLTKIVLLMILVCAIKAFLVTVFMTGNMEIVSGMKLIIQLLASR
jgi:hypothetical protein